MIKSLKVKDNTIAKERLLFSEIKELKKINILFGGNGVGKSTLLERLNPKDMLGNVIESDFHLETTKDIIFMQYKNSIDNSKINVKKELKGIRSFEVAINSNLYSEGQSIIHHILSFLKDVKENAIKNEDKTIVVTLDEVDSGLSSENINFLLHQITEIVTDYNVQFFISSNNYHFTYVYEDVLDMYTGEFITIKSYDEYFRRLNDGIRIMFESGKRDFSFLDIV